jgi:hypothetical protein
MPVKRRPPVLDEQRGGRREGDRHLGLEHEQGERRRPIDRQADEAEHGQRQRDSRQQPQPRQVVPPRQHRRRQHFIHKLHTGASLENPPYLIYGFGGAVSDFSDILYPGDRRDCAKCHVTSPAATYLLPLPANVLATRQTMISSGVETTVGSTPPIQDACLSCHDAADAAGHAQLGGTTVQHHRPGRPTARREAGKQLPGGEGQRRPTSAREPAQFPHSQSKRRRLKAAVAELRDR